ncbi:S-adenosyl-L-methionine-dependent methyltransferase [Tricharina praecox]|uniref:S-adenosyl-L-methionine-dependent methyltransferase n=1 Tax=Tricharina praecox TaxID=43433 RepID=UPI00221E438A|nr:S-adenosyl-L-methionine-dependent methyltransferase [Tricharina praecox]KAI5858879.1 S-adenosyl-L-methionine-dependent methyltransferase [Tricharina praecox]
MDSQLRTHPTTYAYTHAYFPLFYDLWVTSLFGTGADAISPLLCRLFPHTPSPKILDIGTGTGAVIRALPAAANGAEIWAVDHSEAMLARARETTQREVHWVCASAASLPEVEVDLAVSAAGGVGHLVDREERKAFLKGLARVLRQGGVAVVSVLRDEEEGNGEGDGAQAEVLALQSEDRIVYKKTPTTATWAGDVRTDRFVVERWVGGERQWRGECQWSILARWDDERWRAEIEEAGLRVSEVVDGEIQRWWVLEKRE